VLFIKRFIQCKEMERGNSRMIVDNEILKKWSDPYRNWFYYPDHVIPAQPNIKGFEDVRMTDVPTVFQLAGDQR